MPSVRTRVPALLLLGATLLVTPEPARAQTRLTLEQLLAHPFPSALVASAGGGKFAWVLAEQGRRNVWVAEAPAYRARQVTRYADDDGQEITELRFTPDGRALLYVRGGGANRQGEIPNPLSWTEAPEQAIWIAPLEGGTPRRLAAGSQLALSPKGDRVAFVRRGQIWGAPLDGSTEARQWFAARGSAGSLAWSPDGARLAFVSRRGDHAFVGIFDPAESRVLWLDPSTGRDRSPVWSADGKQLAFVRIPNERDVLPYTPARERLPWSIRVADAATGRAREIWRADEGAGSAFWAGDQGGEIYWAAGERIVFPWEKTGWLHLWSVPAAGGRAIDLTPGEFEVQHVALTPDRREFIVSSNQGDLDRRHLWRVPVAGGTPRPLTTGAGIEWAPAISGDVVAFLASDAKRPARAEVLVGGARRPMLEAAPPIAALVEPEPVTFRAADGLTIHGQLFRPADVKPGEKRPAVLFFHGGSRRQMLLGWHDRGYYHNAYAFNQYLASRGYLVLSVNYRSGTGYGLEFREALDYGAQGASEYRDVVAAGEYLRGRADVDPKRIGLWGGSYGGYLTALGLARNSDLFAAGVDLHGVHNWVTELGERGAVSDPEKREYFARIAFESSPMASVDGWRSPVLLIQGDDDRNVQFSETVDLAEALRRRGVDFEELIFPDEVHDFLVHRNWLTAYRAAADFFDRQLRGVRTAAGK